MPTLSCMSFFSNDTATPEIYTLSLHDALPISRRTGPAYFSGQPQILCVAQVDPRLSDPARGGRGHRARQNTAANRSEEHTSELQSHSDLVCRLLLEKKKKLTTTTIRQPCTPTW